jgi:hypothetical protein
MLYSLCVRAATACCTYAVLYGVLHMCWCALPCCGVAFPNSGYGLGLFSYGLSQQLKSDVWVECCAGSAYKVALCTVFFEGWITCMLRIKLVYCVLSSCGEFYVESHQFSFVCSLDAYV